MTWDDIAAFLRKINKWLPLCIIQFQVAFLDAEWDCVETMIYSRAYMALSIMVAWRLLKQYRLRSWWSLVFPQQQFPPLAFTTSRIFSRCYELWMVKDLNSLQSCAEKHCLWTDWPFSHELWHEVVNHDSPLLAKTKPLVDAPFILNLDSLTCYQLNC